MRYSIAYLVRNKLRIMVQSREEAQKLLRKLRELGIDVTEVRESLCG